MQLYNQIHINNYFKQGLLTGTIEKIAENYVLVKRELEETVENSNKTTRNLEEADIVKLRSADISLFGLELTGESLYNFLKIGVYNFFFLF